MALGFSIHRVRGATGVVGRRGDGASGAFGVSSVDGREHYVFEAIHDGAAILDDEGAILRANHALCDITGFAVEDLVGATPPPFWPDGGADDLRAMLRRDTRDGDCVDTLLLVRENGSRFGAEVRWTPLPALPGETASFLMTIRDLAEETEAIDRIRASAALYRSIVEDHPGFIIRWLPDGTRTYANPSYCAYFGQELEQVIGTSFLPTLRDSERRRTLTCISDLTPGSPVASVELEIQPPDGSHRWHRWTHRGFFDDNGELAEILSVGRDVTDLIEARRIQGESEERISKAFEVSPNLVAIFSLQDGRFLDVNDVLVDRMGYARDRFLSGEIREPDLWVDPSEGIDVREIMLREGVLQGHETRFQTANGETIDVLIAGARLDLSGPPVMLGVATDITALKRAQAEVRRSERTLAQAFRTIPDPAFILRFEDSRFVEVNERFVTESGYRREDLLDGTVGGEVFWADPDRRSELRSHVLRQGSARDVEVELKMATGEVRAVRLSVEMIEFEDVPCLLGVAVDVTDTKRALREREEALVEVERLRAELEVERDYLREEFEVTQRFGEIVGESSVLQRVLAQIEAVAETGASVLISGETGVGKELVARAIHSRGPRAGRALVKVNCPSIPRELFESEFFGHVKGAFTGALSDRVGRFQLANLGTIFLDEVSEIPLELQPKLLRVLQNGEFEPVGVDATRSVDVRVIAATNRDLSEEVAAGRFREDLYYRLSVFPIVVPPLRDRGGDIELLARHFLQIACSDLRRPQLSLSAAHIRLLTGYDWPGNIRELRNVIERAVILTRGDRLRLELAVPERDLHEEAAEADGDRATEGILTAAQMRERERENLLAALERTNWKISGPGGAAELLGLKPSSLAYRLKARGIRRSK